MSTAAEPLHRRGPHAELVDLSASELAGRIRSQRLTSRDLVEAYLERIDAFDGREGLNAYITVASSSARSEAQRMDDLMSAGTVLGPLHGLPIAVKDNIDTAGLTTTGGSKVLADHVPDRDATVVERLKAAGGIVLGKTNMHEFAFGITNNNPFYGPARNPFDPSRVTGGSSGGSAGAVAAGLCAAALGSDTGGSIRIPSALCGCVGLKPSNGIVPREGLLQLSFTCDCIGPIARSVEDVELLISVIADDHNVGSQAPSDWTDAAGDRSYASWNGVSLGVPREYFCEDLHPAVMEVLSEALEKMGAAGAELVDLGILGMDQIVEPGYAIVLPEAVYLISRYMEQLEHPVPWEEVLAGMSPKLREIFRGQLSPDSSYSGHDYLQAVRRFRSGLRREVSTALDSVDALVVATTPLPAARIGEDDETMLNGRPVDTFETYFRNTFFANLVGTPAITVPAGTTDAGLPIGIQFVAREGDDHKLIDLGRRWEVLAPFDRR